MLPSSESPSEPKQRRGRGQANVNWIKNEDLKSTPTEVKILAVNYEAENRFNKRPSIVLKLALNGQTKFWRVDIAKNPNYKKLLDRFGAEENDWLDNKVLLALEQHGFYGNYYPSVSFLDEKPKAGKK
jgi:hypothetical protein